MQKRLLVLPLIFAWSIGQFSSPAVILPPPPSKKIALSWEYPELSSNIVFNIYGTTNPSTPLPEWPLIATISETSCSLPMQADSFFFVVTASNVVTNLESDFSQQENSSQPLEPTPLNPPVEPPDRPIDPADEPEMPLAPPEPLLDLPLD